VSGASTDATRPRVRPVFIGAFIVVAVKAVLAASVLLHGFSHVSDDDFSRVVIAEGFAHAPKLDPSGTSWLPFPFWVNGAAMMLLGRSLPAAWRIATELGVVAPLFVYAALRVRNVQHACLLALAAFAAPWLAWLSVATVPEAFTAGLASAGVIALYDARSLDRRDVAFAACLLCACLSRYEAWPMAAAACVAVVNRARRFGGARLGVIGAIAIAVLVLGPLGWMAWNAHAHGDALHFLARVSRFRQNAGQAEGSAFDKSLFVLASVREAPEIMFALVPALAGLAIDRTMRARWSGPLSACLATFAFLTIGAMRDGAPTHHPARALTIVFPVVFAAGLDSVRALYERFVRAWPQGWRGALAMIAVLGVVALPAWNLDERPGDGPSENRDHQVARGLELRDYRVPHARVTPCAYEHFALIAAYGAPENVTIVEPATRTEPNANCPNVEELP
jgi:hypothetical protein